MRLLLPTHLASKLSSFDPSYILDKLDMCIVHHFVETSYHLRLSGFFMFIYSLMHSV
jgi:hypothetical protein